MQSPEYHRRYYLANKERLLAKNRAWKEAHPDEYRRISRDWRRANPTVGRNQHYKSLGILNSDGTVFTEEDCTRALTRQEGRCKMCKHAQTTDSKRLAADHDHKTGKFRGLLCMTCNVKLGFYEDSAFRVKAEAYLLGGK